MAHEDELRRLREENRILRELTDTQRDAWRTLSLSWKWTIRTNWRTEPINL